jgi:cell division initiation protein
MAKLTIVDIQHKSFKKALQGYDRGDVDQYLEEIMETLEDEAHARAALEADVADLKERISHFKSMEDTMNQTLILAQRTADEVKANAHKEADLIKQQARIAAEREIAELGDRIDDARREAQRHQDTAEKAKSELRSLLMSHLAILERIPQSQPAAQPQPQAVAPEPLSPPPAPSTTVVTLSSEIDDDTDTLEQLPLANGAPTHKIVH